MNRIVYMVLKKFGKVPGAWFKLLNYAKNTDKYPQLEKYQHIRYIFKEAIDGGNIDLEIYGTENIPIKDGFMMISNHQGLFDIMAIAAGCERPWRAVLKKELYDIPFMKQIVDCTHSYPMDREDLRQSMKVIQAVTKDLQNGDNFLIFPEGTRSKLGNKTIDFHSGTFKCATKSKCDILPIALIDCYKVLDQKGHKPVKVQLHYLKPITFDEYEGMNTTELANLVRSRIDATLEQYSEE
ncbi:MAG: 1-acyl-sn-glycerol-3-phosphate acyltransferase [Lachnospiraceae bacterium]|nr:1-acyl-sn-glycerol-3-phosphate acyltransferase [Lachnospiraceae bacterium]